MSTARCCDCGSRFEHKRDEAWKTRCTPCWIRMRRAQTFAEERSRKERRCQDCGQHFTPGPFRETRCYSCSLAHDVERILREKAQASRPALTGAAQELPERLRALLQLCHPDKHAGSDLATTTTQWLGLVRKELQRTGG